MPRNIKRFTNQPGIYKITNTVNSRLYVGSAVQVSKRLMVHKASLRGNYHPNAHLQAAWNKYGEESFVFELIENCPIDQLITREQFYLDTLTPHYNVLTTAHSSSGFKHSVETLKNAKERMKLKSKSIKQFDIGGNLIKVWPSIRSIETTLHYNRKNIVKVCKKEWLFYHNSIWRYTDDSSDVLPINGKRIKKAVYSIEQLSLEHQQIKVWSSASEVAKHYKFLATTLRNAIKNNRPYKGFRWRRIIK